MLDYLLFRKMIAPFLLKILFWPALLASIYYSIQLIASGLTIGWIPLIIGSLFVRVAFEVMLLFFSINEKLEKISQVTQNSAQKAESLSTDRLITSS